MSTDREYKIKITTDANVSGATRAQEALESLGEGARDINTHFPEGAELWAKYKNILSETGHESGKLEEHHKVLKFAMQQLGLEIPGLELLLKGIFNPATVAVIGLAGAQKLWNERIEQGVEALSGMKLPDLSEHVAQLSVAATNATTYAEALYSITEAYNSIEASSDRATKKIQQEGEAQRKLIEARREAALAQLEANKGSMSETEYARRRGEITGKATSELENSQREQDEKEIEQLKRRREALITSAAVKRETANRISIASAETDQANLADAKAQNDAAKEAKASSHEWINRIAEAKDSNWEALKTSPAFYMRYGMNTSGSEAMAIEQSNIENAQVVIDRYEKMLKDQPRRNAERANREKLLQEAGKDQGAADVLGQSIPEEQRARSAARANQFSVDQLKNNPALAGASDQQLSMRSAASEFVESQSRLALGHGTPRDSETVRAMNQLLAATRQGDHAAHAALQEVIQELIRHKQETERRFNATVSLINYKGK